MANRIDYVIGFKGDTTQLKASINDAISSLQRLGTMSTNQVTSELRNASSAALELSNHLRNATNVNTGKLDLINFNKSLERSGKTIQQYAQQMNKLGPDGQKAFLQVANAVVQAELPLRRSSQLMDKLWISMKNAMNWKISSSAINAFVGGLQSAYGYSKDLNQSLNNIRLVTEKSTSEMKNFAKEANKAAKNLSSATLDYTDASLIYYQQGLSDQEVKERTDTTIKMANVTRDSAQTVSDQMTAIWNNFDDGSKSLEYYSDVIVRLGADTASSSAEIAQGLEKFAAVADTVGLSYEYATAALATVTATTRQSADIVGNAFKTLFARIQGLKLGETLDDGTTLNKYSEALAAVGISIFDQSGQLKDMNNILDEMGNKWNKLSKDQQVALAQTVAGVRQYTQLIALMDNWDFFEKNVSSAMNAEGSLERQAQIYAESWEAARDRVRAAQENIYDSIINDQMFIDLDNSLTPVLNGIASIADAAGGLKGILIIAAQAMTALYGDKIAQGLRNTATNISIITGFEQKKAQITQEEAVTASENLDKSLVANKLEETELRLLRDKAALQKEINDRAHQYTEEQLLYIENERQNIALLEEGMRKSAQRITNAQSNIDVYSDDLSYQLYNKQTNIDPDSYDQIMLNRESNFKNSVDSILKNDNSLDAANNLLNLLKQRNNALVGYEQLTVQFQKFEKQVDHSTEKLIEFAKIANMKNPEGVKNIGEIKEHMNDVQKATIETRNQIGALRKLLVELGADEDTIQKLANGFRELSSATYDNTVTAETYEDSLDRLNDKIEKNAIPKTNDWASIMVTAVNVLSQVAMGIQAIQNLDDIWSDENLSNTEKMVQLLSSITMILPMINTSATFLATTLGITMGAAFGWAIAILAVGVAIAKAIDIAVVTQKEATEAIQKSNEALEEERKKLDDINSALKETSDRLEELNSKDTLTLTEKQELENLKTKNALLKRQKELQESLVKLKAEETFNSLKNNIDKKYQNKTQSSTMLGFEDEITGETYYISGFSANSALQKEYNVGSIEEARTTYFNDVSKLAEIEEDYAKWVENDNAAKIELENKIAEITETIINLKSVGSQLTETDYDFLKTEAESIKKDYENLYGLVQYQQNIVSTGFNLNDAKNYLSNPNNITGTAFEKQLLELGVDPTAWIERARELQNIIGDNNISSEDLTIAAELDLTGINKFDELIEKIEEYKDVEIDITVKTQGLKELQEAIDKLEDFQKPLKSAMESYAEKGFLTVDEANELIEANADYAKYLLTDGSGKYKLAQQALDDFEMTAAEQQKTLDKLIQDQQNYVSNFEEIVTEYNDAFHSINTDNEFFSRFFKTSLEDIKNFNYENIKSALSLISNEGINAIGLTSIVDEDIKSQTKPIEEALGIMSEAVSASIVEINQQFSQGKINVQDYYKYSKNAIEALIKIYSKSNGALKRDIESGKWYFANVEDATEEIKASGEAAAAELNRLEEELKDLNSLDISIELFTDIDKGSYKDLLEIDEIGIVTIKPEVNEDDLNKLKEKFATAYKSLGDSDVAEKIASTMGMTIDRLKAQIEDFDSDDLGTFFTAYRNAMIEETQDIPALAKDAMNSVAKVLEEFDYTLSFTPKGPIGGKGSVAKSLITGDWSNFELPSFEYKISGNGEATVNNIKAMGEAVEKYQQTLASSGVLATANLADFYNLNPFNSAIADPSKVAAALAKDAGKVEKQLPKFADRYYDITRQIEKYNEALSESETQINRTFGNQKLKLIKNQEKEIKNLINAYKEQERQALVYLEEDKKILESLIPNQVLQIDKATGELLNAEEILRKAFKNYLDAGIGNSAAEEIYDRIVEAVHNLNDTSDKIIETRKAIEEQRRAEEDRRLREAVAELNLSIQIKNMDDAAREFSKTIAESMGDALTHGLRTARLSAQAAKSEMGMLDEYADTLDNLERLWDSANKYTDTEAIAAEFENVQGEIISSGEVLLDWIDTLENMVPDAVDAAAERFDKFINQLEHNSTVLETIKELLALQGYTYKTTEGFAALEKVAQGRMEASLEQAKLQRQWFEGIEVELRKAEEALAGVAETDVAYDTLKNNRDALLEEYNEAQEAMLSAAKDTMEAAREIFINAVEKASHDLEMTLTNNLGFDLLQMKYDNLIETEERYLDKVNETYEVIKWNNKLQKSIDTTSSASATNKLKELQKEIELRRESGKLSKYDLDILNAKYEMTLAQIALEEAQNNKSSMRLVRNSAGNWDYIFTSDAQKIADAQAEYADAQNKYYNTAKDEVSNVMKQMLDLKRETAELIEEVYLDETLTEEERSMKLEEIRNNFNSKMLYLQEEYNISLKDMNDAGNEIIIEHGNTFEEVFKLMGDTTLDFEGIYNDAQQEMEQAAQDYKETIKQVTSSVGVDYEDLTNIIDDTTDATNKVGDAGKLAADKIFDSLNAIHKAARAYADWADEVEEVIDRLEELSRIKLDDPGRRGHGYDDRNDDEKKNSNSSNQSSIVNPSTGGINPFYVANNIAQGLTTLSQEKPYLTKAELAEVKKHLHSLGVAGYDTGGYTGAWGSEGKLAILHEKELVLNQEDTSNILTAVSAIRTLSPVLLKEIEKLIDNNAMIGQNLMGARLNGYNSFVSGTNQLEQSVLIQAEFPGVTAATEIEAALNNLINDAAQYASIR